MANTLLGFPCLSGLVHSIFEVDITPRVSAVFGKRLPQELGQMLAFLLQNTDFGAAPCKASATSMTRMCLPL